MFESRISAVRTEKLPYSENFRISSWSYDMEGHAKKCVERYGELANKTTQQLNKISTPCIDDHHFKEEEMKSVGELSQVCSQIVLKCSCKMMVKRNIDKKLRLRNFDARNERIETRAVVTSRRGFGGVGRGEGLCCQWKAKGQCSRGDQCSVQHDTYERAKPTPETVPSSQSQDQEEEVRGEKGA